MSDTVFMADLSWKTYAERVKQGVVMFLPLGATEQHGPHLPMSTDALTSAGISAGVAREVGGLVAPTVNFGYKSQPRMGGGQDFVGTTSLDATTFATVLRVEFAAAIRAALPAGVPVVCGAPATAVREVDGGRRAAVSFGCGVPE